MKKEHIKLTEQDKSVLHQIIEKGVAKARVHKRAFGLLQLDSGVSFRDVSKSLKIKPDTVSDWCERYKTGGLDRALNDEQRPGRPIEINGESKAKITALACSDPPDGRLKWTLRLLADRIVELEYCEGVSHTYVGDILKKTNINPI